MLICSSLSYEINLHACVCVCNLVRNFHNEDVNLFPSCDCFYSTSVVQARCITDGNQHGARARESVVGERERWGRRPNSARSVLIRSASAERALFRARTCSDASCTSPLVRVFGVVSLRGRARARARLVSSGGTVRKTVVRCGA